MISKYDLWNSMFTSVLQTFFEHIEWACLYSQREVLKKRTSCLSTSGLVHHWMWSRECDHSYIIIRSVTHQNYFSSLNFGSILCCLTMPWNHLNHGPFTIHMYWLGLTWLSCYLKLMTHLSWLDDCFHDFADCGNGHSQAWLCTTQNSVSPWLEALEISLIEIQWKWTWVINQSNSAHWSDCCIFFYLHNLRFNWCYFQNIIL